MMYQVDGLANVVYPYEVDIPVETIIVTGVASGCSLAIVQSDWVYHYAPASIDVQNIFNVFDNGRLYEVRVMREGYSYISVPGIDSGSSVCLDVFYNITIPQGVTNIKIVNANWVDTTVWYDNHLQSDVITLMKNYKEAWVTYDYNGETFSRISFMLDGTNPFSALNDTGIDPGIDPGSDPGSDPGNDPGNDPRNDSRNDPGNDAVSDAGNGPGNDPGNDPPDSDVGNDSGNDAGNDAGNVPFINVLVNDSGSGSWSILSLIFALLSVLGMLRVLKNEGERRINVNGIIVIILVLANAVILFATQNFGGQMVWINQATILMGIITAAIAVVMVFSKKVDKNNFEAELDE